MSLRYSPMACDILVHSDIKLKIYYREKYRRQYYTDAFTAFSLFSGVIIYITFLYDFYMIRVYLLTAIGLTLGGSSTVHIYIKTVRRTEHT
jgi:hypothetical protein